MLRRARREDTESLVAFNRSVHTYAGPGLAEAIADWTRERMTRPHPGVSPAGFTVVEDTRTGAIVSSLCLISQTWGYGGVPLGVGRVETVGTHPGYRRRGLVRAQFREVHAWSAVRGHLLNYIGGLPNFYRQFGYEPALDQQSGRAGPSGYVPALAEREVEPYRVRPAEEGDVHFIAHLAEHAAGRYLVTCRRDEALWRFELGGRDERDLDGHHLAVIESAAGESAGLLAYRGDPEAGVHAYELTPGVSWA